MALILPVHGIYPTISTDTWLAPNATVVGDVILGNACSVWFNAVIRGDVNAIRIGDRVNIQDGSCIHCTYKKHATLIASDVSIGHHAIIHGCTIEDQVLVGMGAIIMDACHIKPYSIIGAGAVLTEGTVVETGSIMAGVPARKIKQLEVEQIKQLTDRTASNYVLYKSWFEA